MIEFTVRGIPKPQPPKRSFVLRGKNGRPILNSAGEPIIRQHDMGTAEGWKMLIAEAVKALAPAEPLAGPIVFSVDFYFPRLKSFPKRTPATVLPFAQKPDVDNLCKALFDTLTMLHVWHDDRQVTELRARKFYAAEGCAPGAYVSMVELESPLPKAKPPKRGEPRGRDDDQEAMF